VVDEMKHAPNANQRTDAADGSAAACQHQTPEANLCN
jgi:hypothetical protein